MGLLKWLLGKTISKQILIKQTGSRSASTADNSKCVAESMPPEFFFEFAGIKYGDTLDNVIQIARAHLVVPADAVDLVVSGLTRGQHSRQHCNLT